MTIDTLPSPNAYAAAASSDRLARQMLIEQRVTNDGKSTGVAIAFWFFLGLLGGHRFYLGRPGSALLLILCNCLVIGWIWTLIDLFLIPGMVRKQKDDLRAKYTSLL